MDQRPGPPDPRLLKMPLRDVARGLKGAAVITQDVLAPVVAALPGPLQSALSDALSAIKSQGKSVLTLIVQPPEIEAAAQFVAGRSDDAAASAKVIAFAWDHLNLGDLASETVLASHLSQITSDGESPETHAASVLLAMADSNAFGKLPGVPGLEGVAERAQIAAALVAPTIWLLAEREDTLEDELHLLDLARALTEAFQSDVRAALTEEDKLGPLLKMLAQHL